MSWRRTTTSLTVGSAVCALIAGPTLHAQLCEGAYVFSESAPFSTDGFGASVDLDGSVIAVGVPEDDTFASNAGAVWLYDQATGDTLFTLLPLGSAADIRFGASVAVDAGAVVIGAPLSDLTGEDAGTASLYDAVTGAFVKRLQPGDLEPGQQFGRSADVSAGLAVVGAADPDLPFGEGYGAWLFDVSAGAVEPGPLARLEPATSLPQDGFGFSVAIGGQRVLVGAPRDSLAGPSRGSVSVFDVSVPTRPVLERTLTPGPSSGSFDFFGASIAVDGDLALIGSPNAGDGAPISGAVSLFDLTTGERLAHWTAEDPVSHHEFGASVALQGDVALVGAPGYAPPQSLPADSGIVWVYDLTDRQAPKRLTWLEPDQPTAGQHFGDGVALAGGAAAIGAPGKVLTEGYALATLIPPRGFSPTGQGHSGFFNPFQLWGSGDLSPGSPVSLSFGYAAPGTPTFLVVGLTRLDQPFKGGVLVPFPDLVLAGPTTDGFGGWTLGSTWPSGLPADLTTWWQVWVPGPFEPTGFGASNALMAVTPCP